MRPDEKRPAESGNSPRVYDEAAPSESITFNVPPTAEQRERVARLRRIEADDESRKAAREFDELMGDIYSRPRLDYDPLAYSRELDRRTANDLVMVRGFDPEYVAALYGLTLRAGVSV